MLIYQVKTVIDKMIKVLVSELRGVLLLQDQ